MTDNVQRDFWTRVPYPDHPDRCEGIAKGAQCLFFKVEDSKYCKMHGGRPKDPVEIYKLTKHRARMKELKEHSELFSLREEIGVLRITLEETLNQAANENMGMFMHSGKITALVGQIGKLVVDAKKLESGLGRLMDQQVVLALAGHIVEAVAQVVSDEDQLREVAEAIDLIIQTHILGVEHA